MRLLKTLSHTSERQGYDADKIRQKKEGVDVKDRNESSTKAIAVPPARGMGRGRGYGRAKSKKRGGPVPQYG